MKTFKLLVHTAALVAFAGPMSALSPFRLRVVGTGGAAQTMLLDAPSAADAVRRAAQLGSMASTTQPSCAAQNRPPTPASWLWRC